LSFSKKKLLEIEKKLERRNLREEKRKAKRLKRLANREADEMNQRIATEERLLLKAQRKLEAIHLLGELFSRIKVLICHLKLPIKIILLIMFTNFYICLFFSQNLFLKVL